MLFIGQWMQICKDMGEDYRALWTDTISFFLSQGVGRENKIKLNVVNNALLWLCHAD